MRSASSLTSPVMAGDQQLRFLRAFFDDVRDCLGEHLTRQKVPRLKIFRVMAVCRAWASYPAFFLVRFFAFAWGSAGF